MMSESMSMLMVMTDTRFLCLSAHWLALAILSLSLNLSVSDLMPAAILASFLALVRLNIFIVFNLLVIQIFVFKCSPVGDEQSVRIVLCPRHVLNLAHGDDGAFEVTAAALDKLRAEVLELSSRAR
jgi:hypothetical protein